MQTGIFIRVLVDGKHQSMDIGDSTLPDDVLRAFLMLKTSEWLINLIMALLGRRVNNV